MESHFTPYFEMNVLGLAAANPSGVGAANHSSSVAPLKFCIKPNHSFLRMIIAHLCLRTD
jgi:hypothetical protein